MTDLHTRLVEAITTRLALAVTAQRPFDDDAIVMSVWEDGFAAVRSGLESEIERHCRADLELLEQHRPPEQLDFLPVRWTKCRATFCGEVWPCTFVRNRAGVYGVNLDEQEAGT